MDSKPENQNKAAEPFTEYGVYSYADYLTWELDEMVEIIKGRVFRSAAAAPRRIHQKISGNVFAKLHNYLSKHPCEVYEAPFDVRLPVQSKKNEDICTVIQPDICVICDKGKLDEFGCIGAPDLIVEILSPGNNKKELQHKYEVYKESGVKEYWIIHPSELTLLVYTLVDKKYVSSKLFTLGDVVASKCISGFKLDLEEVFSNLD
ncbi:Uma2 family endonuclease [Pararhodonellum marinum]|uniref:Uma2 family endonuclease n=1 Tax=Pararhodonellum marinum TaxID=2755358 RepID=UPI00189026EF|nr:Uma2 family endonuclease [Pararhodonellum marinum]